MVNDNYMLYSNIIENEFHDFLKNNNNIYLKIIYYIKNLSLKVFNKIKYLLFKFILNIIKKIILKFILEIFTPYFLYIFLIIKPYLILILLYIDIYLNSILKQIEIIWEWFFHITVLFIELFNQKFFVPFQ
uniref:Uncharacterized protein n=1 Tax=Orbilia brochopaga TaxID=3140254 RepID=A0A4Y5MV35_9PEZI|nr:hypothetical protein [Drechslerella brochopaga]